MGGFVVQTHRNTRKCFLPKDLLRLIQEKKVKMPVIEDSEIDDRSKANWLTKAIALLQVTWFLLQLLTRAIEHLPTTTLELYTLGIVTCAIFTYAGNWEKPFDVQRPVVLQARVTDYAWPPSLQRTSPLDNSLDYCLSDTIINFLVVLICAPFSASHLIGWKFVFGSLAELWVWRVGSICCAILPIIYVLSLMSDSDSIVRLILLLILFLYSIARVALAVEVFTGLRSVPVGVYQTVRWSDYIPSFG
jgi:hypothetical protein